MSDHARLSPSARSRWAVCPASVREAAKYPNISSPSAIDGTHTHSVLEYCLKNALITTESCVGLTFRDKEGEFVCDKDRAARVQEALNYIYARKAALTNCTIHPESKVNPERLLGRDDLKGTVDCLLLSDEGIDVIDYKDGMSKVEAIGNQQMEVYAWGALAGLPMGASTKTIRMTIIQPKVALAGGDPISHWDISVDDFLKGRDKIIAEAAATDDPNAPFVPGEAQCKWCPAKGACSAAVNHAIAATGLDMASVDVFQQAAEQNPNELSDDKLRELIEMAPMLRQLLEAVEKEALRRMESGQEIEGLKIVRGRGSRSWRYGDEELAAKLKKMGLPKDVIWKTSIITPAQIEKVSWEKRDGTKKQLSEKQLALINTEYISKTSGKLTVASAADSRPAVQVSAVELFKPVVELPAWLT